MAEEGQKVSEGSAPTEEPKSTSLHAKIFGPLGLPEGSVRAILVITSVLTFLYVIATKEYASEKLWSLVVLTTGWYFMDRKKGG